MFDELIRIHKERLTEFVNLKSPGSKGSKAWLTAGSEINKLFEGDKLPSVDAVKAVYNKYKKKYQFCDMLFFYMTSQFQYFHLIIPFENRDFYGELYKVFCQAYDHEKYRNEEIQLSDSKQQKIDAIKDLEYKKYVNYIPMIENSNLHEAFKNEIIESLNEQDGEIVVHLDDCLYVLKEFGFNVDDLTPDEDVKLENYLKKYIFECIPDFPYEIMTEDYCTIFEPGIKYNFSPSHLPIKI